MDKKVTIQEVAMRAGVTAMTVSRVLNESARVAPATRQRVQQAIDELGYIPNALARGLLTGRTRTIGLLVDDISNPYWTAVAHGAEEVAQKNGCSLVLGNIGGSEDRQDELTKTLVGNRVDGLIINAPSGKPLKRLIQSNYPFVLIGPEHRGIHTDVVRGDVYKGAIGLTRHLLSLGHTRIALLNGPKADFESQQRVRGYTKALTDAGVQFDDALVFNGSYAFRGGHQAATAILSLSGKGRPTAIVASNNFLALSAIEMARHFGASIPDDIALVCFDDLVLASIVDPFLTVMSQPARTLGAHASQLLFDHLNSPGTWAPTKLIYPPELIVRRSCGS